MFTGIIEEIGSIRQIKRSGQTLALVINAKLVSNDLKLGDSVAVNGVCLTVTQFNQVSFTVDVMPITFQSTNLFKLNSGSKVNLERALAANGRFGGHIVSGHVDGVGHILTKTISENALIVKIKLPADLAAQCILKGSIALDGTSLTLFEVGSDFLCVSLIPHTQEISLLGQKNIGEIVNIECDILAKQMRQALQQGQKSGDSKITSGFLQQHGYL